MAYDDDDESDERALANEVESAWYSFLDNEIQENQSGTWEAIISDLQFWFEMGYDVDNGESPEIREEARMEFEAILNDYDIDLNDYDWDDWRDWYAAAG